MFDWFYRLEYEFYYHTYDWLSFVYEWIPARYVFIIVLLLIGSAIFYLARRFRGGGPIGFGSMGTAGRIDRNSPQEGQPNPTPAAIAVEPPPLDELEQQILERVIAGANQLSVSSLAEELEVPAEEIRAALDGLAEKGHIML